MSTIDRQESPENQRASEEPPVTEGINPKSRGDERTEIQIHRVGGKTAPVTIRWKRVVAGPVGGKWWWDLL